MKTSEKEGSKYKKLRLSGARYLFLFLVFSVGITLSLVLFSIMHAWAARLLHSEFIILESDRVASIKRSINNNIDLLSAISSFYASSQSVERQEFHIFVQEILERHQDILALNWIPRVPDTQREGFQESVRKEGYPEFQITELDSNGKVIKAGLRKEYFPVYYVEPFQENRAIFGLDLASDHSRLVAMEEARDRGLPIATERIKLVRKPSSDFGCRIFLPIYANGLPHSTIPERRRNLIGFISLLFRIGRTVELALKDFKPAGIDIYLFDETAQNSRSFLYFHQPEMHGGIIPQIAAIETRGQGNLRWSSTFYVAGRKWFMLCLPTREFFATHRYGASWMALLAGIILTVLLVVYLASILGRSARIKLIVEQQTKELTIINEQLRKLSRAVEQSPTGVIITDIQGNIEYVNPQFTQLTGFTPEEALGNNPRILKSGEQPKEFYQQLWETITSGAEWRGEFRNRKKSGELYWESASISPIRNPEGTVTHFVGIKEDITEHKRIDDALKRAYQTTRDIIESAPFGIYIVNKNGNIEYVNPAMLKIAGSSVNQFMGMNVFNFPPYEEVGLTGKIRSGLKGEYFRLDSVQYTSYFGKKTTFRNFYGIPLEDEVARKVLVVVEDITERKRLEQMKDEFLNTVSHELRTPLAIMKEGISQIIEGIHGNINEKQGHLLTMSLGSIDRITRIVGSLLDISKIESGKVVLRREVIDVTGLARGVIGDFLIYAQKKGLELKENFSQKKIEVYADKDRVIQAFTNLVGNAIKFTDKGYVEIGVSDKGDTIECSVTDTGCGISENDLPRLFGKFEQFGHPATSGDKGIGLGLAITKGIVELHQGKISVESKLNQGMKIVFTLPKDFKNVG